MPGVFGLGGISKAGAPAAAALYGMTHSPESEAIFAGKLAKKFNKELAEKYLKPSEFQKRWDETGYFQGMDAQTRFEISDKYAEFNPEELAALREPEGYSFLGRLIDHPELFENYPQLRNMPISPLSPDDISRGVKGAYSPDSKSIEINPGMLDEDLFSTIMHEGQHGVQDIEDFAFGGSPELFTNAAWNYKLEQLKSFVERYDKVEELIDQAKKEGNVKRHDQLVKRLGYLNDQTHKVSNEMKTLSPHSQYERLKGEHEARLVQARLDAPIDEYPFYTKTKDSGLKPIELSELIDKPQDSIAYRYKWDAEGNPKSGSGITSMSDIAQKAGSPFKNDASPYTNPKTGALASLLNNGKELPGYLGALSMLRPEGLINWIDTLARGQKPTWQDRVDVGMDLL